jgi:glycosyltransferase involved in cell wall biosynthesis
VRPSSSTQHPLDPLPPRGRTFVGGFESTHHPAAGVDVLEVTGSEERWTADLDHLLTSGVRHLRVPLRWPRIEPQQGRFDWSATDRLLGALRSRAAVPIVDLVHHTSYPGWLTDGFRGTDFGPAFLRYATAVAGRYPDVPAYTLFNEPFTTLFLAGHEALWPPYDRGLGGFRRLLLSVLPGWARPRRRGGSCCARRTTCGSTRPSSTGVLGRASATRSSRTTVGTPSSTWCWDTTWTGAGRSWASCSPREARHSPSCRGCVDVLGLDYYPHSEWFYDEVGSRAFSPRPAGFAAVAAHYAERYGLPLMLTETNVRGLPSDRASWLRHVLEQYEAALAGGVPLHGFCWFPHVDSADWDSLLTRCADDLTGFTAGLAHWPWRDPPADAIIPPVALQSAGAPGAPPLPEHTVTTSVPDLVVLSHLRWPWVWQRPQHLVSRLAAARATAGARTWFVEEPAAADVDVPEIRTEQHGDVNRCWLAVPRRSVSGEHPGFEAPAAGVYGALLQGFQEPVAAGYGDLLRDRLTTEGRPGRPDVWLYTPMALDVARCLEPGRLVYDVMDDLASFLNAPPGLVLRQRQLLAEADVVFTGGSSLHRSVLRQRRDGVHLFRSGVEQAHYARARDERRPRQRPVAGYVGVIDERLDLDLVVDLAGRLPDWTVRLVGPVAKIDPAMLPRAGNLEYPGMVAYDDLPSVMAGFDVALMPFALNEATRSISPTKTLEYLAAGLPVVSTRVADVVGDYADVVALADDGRSFAAACRVALISDPEARDRRSRPLQRRQEWDAIAAGMAAILDDAAGTEQARSAEEPA